MPDPSGAKDAPKIIVDTDWKSQAQAEKERLAATEGGKSASSPKAPGAAQPGSGEHVEASFEELIRMLASQALLYLGAFPDPETGRAVVALDLAKFNVDLLAVLESKTKGNLNDTEQKLLSRSLYELRMHFVEVSKAVAKAVEEGRVSRVGSTGKPRPPGASPPGPAAP